MKSTKLLILVILGLLLAACGGDGADEDTTTTTAAATETTAPSGTTAPDDTTDDTEPPATSDDPIVVGGTLGLTGAFAGPSADYQVAYDLWLEQVNARGGMLGRPVEMIIYDDESTPATAQALYQRLINEDDVDLLLAPYTTFIGGSILPIVEQNEMVLWNGGFVGVELFQNSDWLIGSYTYQEGEYPLSVFELIESLPEDERPTRVGIATAQNPFTLVVRDGFNGETGVLNYAEEAGMEVVVNEEYPGDVQDLSGIVQRMKAEDVDLFFALTLPNDGALMARTVEELDFNPTIYCSCGSQVTSLASWPDLGSAANGVMATGMAWPESDDYPELDLLWETVQAELGYADMPQYIPVGYSILQVMEQAVNETGTLDQAALRDFVLGNSFETANGPFNYDDAGTPGYNAILMQYLVDAGGNVVVWPEDRATGEPVIPKP